MVPSPLRVAIIGAGFSAHAAAIAILRRAIAPVRVALIDPKEECGGLAYGQAGVAHILNTRASQFSVLADDPADFVKWARAAINGLQNAEGVEDAYLPRRHVQSYIRQRFAEAACEHPHTEALRIRNRVTRITRRDGAFQIQLANNKTVEADVAILASGYGADRRLTFGLDPFGEMSPRRAGQAKRIAFVGSGLTFIDGYLRIRALGFEGEAISISRSARLPAPHAISHVVPSRMDIAPGTPLLEILRLSRARARSLGPDSDWRSVVNGLRTECQVLWQSLSAEDKARFDRHLRPIWDRLRHRAPPHIHAAVIRDIESGKLRLEKGRVTAARHGLNGWTVDAEQSGERARLGPFDLVFDCSGPGVQSVHPLAAPLIAEGYAQRNSHGGLTVLPSGAVVGAGGNATPGLYALGPLGAGSLLEITAAPEIVAQAEALAKELSIYEPIQTDKLKESLNARRPAHPEHRKKSPPAIRAARTSPRG